MAELADAADSKSVGLITRVGSSPTIPTKVESKEITVLKE